MGERGHSGTGSSRGGRVGCLKRNMAIALQRQQRCSVGEDAAFFASRQSFAFSELWMFKMPAGGILVRFGQRQHLRFTKQFSDKRQPGRMSFLIKAVR
jgi:hypothetical protein